MKQLRGFSQRARRICRDLRLCCTTCLKAFVCFWTLLGLERDLLHRKVVQLSGGQRQRIILSMAAMLGKRLLLADEPTSALDEDCVGRVSALFRRLTAGGTAVLSVSHNRAFLEACDRVVKL